MAIFTKAAQLEPQERQKQPGESIFLVKHQKILTLVVIGAPYDGNPILSNITVITNYWK
ncbi:hypothetical protein D3C71_2145760 [compost metagenome]